MHSYSLFALPLLILSGSAVSAETQAPPAGKPASIPFIDIQGLNDFRPDGDNAVYLQDRSWKWYRATLMAPCTALSFATTIAVKTRGSGSLDKFGSLLVEGQDCRIEELLTSGPPPKKVKAAKQKA